MKSESVHGGSHFVRKLCLSWCAVIGLHVFSIVDPIEDVTLFPIQIITGFLLVTFFPGLGILTIIDRNSDERDGLIQVCYAVGISVMLQMFILAGMSVLLTKVGVTHPMSAEFVRAEVVVLNIILISATAGLRINDMKAHCESRQRRTAPISLMAFPLIAPALSIAGAMASYKGFGNELQLIAVGAVLVLFTFLVMSSRVKGTLTGWWILCAGLGILFLGPLASEHINASDMAAEYGSYVMVERSEAWRFDEFDSILSGVLSVSLLPVAYHYSMGIDGEMVFKVVLPTIMGFLPLTLFILLRGLFGEKASVISVFFFVSFGAFFSLSLSDARIGVAEFFLTLVLLLFFVDAGARGLRRSLLKLIFIAALVVSYYALAILFIISIGIGMVILSSRGEGRSLPGLVNSKTLLLSLALFIGWYLYTAEGYVFSTMVWIGQDIYESVLWGYSATEARDPIMRMMLGFEGPPTVLYSAMTWVYRATQMLVALGAIVLLKRIWVRRVSDIREMEYFCFVLAGMSFLALSVAQPFFAKMGVTRLYQMTLLFLSPCFVIGASTLIDAIRNRELRVPGFPRICTRKNMQLAFSAILVPYFILSSGLAAEITDDHPVSYTLSGDTMRDSDDWLTNLRGETFLIRTEEIEIALWISEFRGTDFIIRSDDISAGTVLAPYAGLTFGEYEEVATVQYIGLLHGYLYLRHISVVENLYIQRNLDKSFLEWQVAGENSVDTYLSRADLLVTNGESCIYFWDSQLDTV